MAEKSTEAAAKSPTKGHAPRGLETYLEPGEAACFLIDPVRATLEAANAQARTLFKLTSEALPKPVDSAMPAFNRLRHEASDASTSQDPQILDFWTGGRLLRLTCVLTAIDDSEGRRLIRIRVVPDRDKDVDGHAAEARGEGVTPSSPPDRSSDAECPEAPPCLSLEESSDAGPGPGPSRRTDAETLKEIARRIRQGFPARQEPREEDPTLPSQDAQILPPEPAGDPPDAKSLAKLAHELKTPLSAIVAASEIMRDQRLGDMGNARYLGYASDIHQSARHALDVINAMLTRGAREFRQNSVVALGEVAAETVSAMSPLAAAAGVSLSARSDDGPLDILADATAVRQIIYNLVNNALKFTPSGGDVHVLSGYLDDGSVYLVVRDTGQGMEEETIARAFFADLGTVSPRPGGGYGIGLPMVRQLALSIGASLDVDSAPGKGTAILLTFARVHS